MAPINLLRTRWWAIISLRPLSRLFCPALSSLTLLSIRGPDSGAVSGPRTDLWDKPLSAAEASQPLLPPVWQQALLSPPVTPAELCCWLKDMGSRHPSLLSLSHTLFHSASLSRGVNEIEAGKVKQEKKEKSQDQGHLEVINIKFE